MKLFFPYFRQIVGISVLLLLGGCSTKPYAPPPKKAVIESVEVKVHDFEGRPEASAIVKGRLSSSVALLVDASQTREGNVLYISVMEQTPRGAIASPDLGRSPPFEKRIPIDILGLKSGKYTVVANGITAPLEIPELFDIAPRDFSKKAPHKVKWRPAPLPTGTVKMMPSVQVNRQSSATRQITNSVNANTASDPFSAQHQALPPGMTASVSMAPPPTHQQRSKPTVKEPVPAPTPINENVPTFDSLAGSSNTVSTLSGASAKPNAVNQF